MADAVPFAALLRALNEEPGQHPDRITADSVARDLLADARASVLVAEEGGMIVGLATGHPYYDSGTSAWGMVMNDLYVAPEARRRGLGRALVEAMARTSAAQGGAFLWWDADMGDALAQAFHRGIGAAEEPTLSFILRGEAFGAASAR